MTSPAAPPWPPPSATAPGTPTQAWQPPDLYRQVHEDSLGNISSCARGRGSVCSCSGGQQRPDLARHAAPDCADQQEELIV